MILEEFEARENAKPPLERLRQFFGGDSLRPAPFGTRKPTLYLDRQNRRWIGVNLNGVARDVTAWVDHSPMGGIPAEPSNTYLYLVAIHLGHALCPRRDDERHLGVISVYFLDIA